MRYIGDVSFIFVICIDEYEFVFVESLVVDCVVDVVGMFIISNDWDISWVIIIVFCEFIVEESVEVFFMILRMMYGFSDSMIGNLVCDVYVCNFCFIFDYMEFVYDRVEWGFVRV